MTDSILPQHAAKRPRRVRNRLILDCTGIVLRPNMCVGVSIRDSMAYPWSFCLFFPRIGESPSGSPATDIIAS